MRSIPQQVMRRRVSPWPRRLDHASSRRLCSWGVGPDSHERWQHHWTPTAPRPSCLVDLRPPQVRVGHRSSAGINVDVRSCWVPPVPSMGSLLARTHLPLLLSVPRYSRNVTGDAAALSAPKWVASFTCCSAWLSNRHRHRYAEASPV